MMGNVGYQLYAGMLIFTLLDVTTGSTIYITDKPIITKRPNKVLQAIPATGGCDSSGKPFPFNFMIPYSCESCEFPDKGKDINIRLVPKRCLEITCMPLSEFRETYMVPKNGKYVVVDSNEGLKKTELCECANDCGIAVNIDN